MLRGIRRNFFRLSPCCGQVPYVLLTRAPVAGGSIAAPPLPLDLHVLSLSLAFILSQDQTLRCCLSIFLFLSKIKMRQTKVSFVVAFARRSVLCGPVDAESIWIFRIDLRTSLPIINNDSCTTFYLVYCNSFNVLFPRFRGIRKNSCEMSCKVMNNFSFLQIFNEFLTSF